MTQSSSGGQTADAGEGNDENSGQRTGAADAGAARNEGADVAAVGPDRRSKAWPARGTSPGRKAKKHVILFLAANPSATDRLALDREARAIHLELKRSGYRDRFDFVTRWAAEPLDLLRELRELQPTVVHFSGHGGARPGVAERSMRGRELLAGYTRSGGDPFGLYFHNAAGATHYVSPDALVQTLDAAGAPVRLLVLNASFTETIAEAALAHIDCVVGMSGSIHDDAARAFAVGFYGGLGESASISAAFEHGRAAIHLDGLPDAERPRLKVRTGFDADELILAAVPPVIRMDLPCPYPGMRSYTADDAAGFHGRDAEIDEVIARLRAGDREIYVIGPSGSGKSSLMAAGVLPRLVRGVAGAGPFVVRTMRPGEHPAARLCEALDLSPGEPFLAVDRIATLLAYRSQGSLVLLVIDQLEELFTLATASERDAFLAALRALRSEPRLAVIVTLRADFFGALMESSLWPDSGRKKLSRIEVGPLRGGLLREAIAAPARDSGVVIEPELVERLLADAASEPGILPLLQETMVQLWDQRADQTLTLADYQALGDGSRNGLAVAVVRRADETLKTLTEAQTELARRILVRLISFGEGRSDTRRQQPVAQLRTADDNAADFAIVLQALVDNRLLTMDEDDHIGEARVDLAHEVLIAAWPVLADWARSHRVDEQKRRQLEATAIQWVTHGRGIRSLLDPIELADAEAWQHTESARQLGYSAEVVALIAASRAEHIKRENAAREQANELAASERASRRLLAQMYAETGRQLLLDGHAQEAVAYLLAARQRGLDDPPLRVLFHVAKCQLPLVPALQHQGEVVSAAFSLDGTRVATASWDHSARVWDATTGTPLTSALEHQDEVTSVAFSSDGTRVVTASRDHTARVWDAATGEPLTGPLEHQKYVSSAEFSPDDTRVVTASGDHTARVWDAVAGKPLTGALEHQGPLVSATFSPDGTRLVTVSEDKAARTWNAATGKPLTRLDHTDKAVSAAFSSDGIRVVTASEDRTARVWDAATGKLLSRLDPQEFLGAIQSAAFSPDGVLVVTAHGNGTVRVWDAATGKPLTSCSHPQGVASAAFSPDGARVVSASWDRTARVWGAATGQPFTTPLVHQGPVVSARFSLDGTRIVTASMDNTARVWSAVTGNLKIGFHMHKGPVRSAAFSPEGSRVVTTSEDNTARVWDVRTGRPLTCPLRHQGYVLSASFSPDGTRVVTASRDNTACVWDAITGKPITWPLMHQHQLESVAFSPDGNRVVTASLDETARVWDAATGEPLTSPLKHQRTVKCAAFSPDGLRVVTASLDETARVWNAATGKPITSPLKHRGEVLLAAFSPDGTRLITTSDKTVQFWDSATGKPLATSLDHHDDVVSAAFSPDGLRVVSANWDGSAQVWDVATGKPISSPLEHGDSLTDAVFSPDGTCVLTASRDGTARVWDATTGKPLTSPLRHSGSVESAAFSPDGTCLVTASRETALVWDIRPDTTTLEQWSLVAERSPFVLDGIALVRRR